MLNCCQHIRRGVGYLVLPAICQEQEWFTDAWDVFNAITRDSNGRIGGRIYGNKFSGIGM
jgi:hypothetical protein